MKYGDPTDFLEGRRRGNIRMYLGLLVNQLMPYHPLGAEATLWLHPDANPSVVR